MEDKKLTDILAGMWSFELEKPFAGSGRDMVTDNFFTSHDLAVNLLHMNLTLLGTIRNHRREIPEELRNGKRPVESSLFAYDHENKIMLVSYIPKKEQECNFAQLISCWKACPVNAE